MSTQSQSSSVTPDASKRPNVTRHAHQNPSPRRVLLCLYPECIGAQAAVYCHKFDLNISKDCTTPTECSLKTTIICAFSELVYIPFQPAYSLRSRVSPCLDTK